MRYKVEFRRVTRMTCHLVVDASSEDEARRLADEMTADSDDELVDEPESYEYDCRPTGAVEPVDEGEDE